MRACWAKSLGDCDGKPLTSEHMITRGMFDKKKIEMFGLSFLKEGEKREMSIDAVTVRALCGTHNSALSELDDAAIDFSNVLTEVDRVARVRRASPAKQWPRLALGVDGLRFERWCLKTLVNYSLHHPKEAKGWVPSPELVEAIYGRRQLGPGIGFGIQFDVNGHDAALLHHSIAITFISKPNEVGAGLLHFGGLFFICSWAVPLSELRIQGPSMAAGHAVWHPPQFLLDDVNVAIKFDWTGKMVGRATRLLRANRIVVPR